MKDRNIIQKIRAKQLKTLKERVRKVVVLLLLWYRVQQFNNEMHFDDHDGNILN